MAGAPEAARAVVTVVGSRVESLLQADSGVAASGWAAAVDWARAVREALPPGEVVDSAPVGTGLAVE